MNKKSVGIIGCGWLGRVLAQQLLVQGYSVKATVRDVDKQATLLASGIDCERLSVPEEATALQTGTSLHLGCFVLRALNSLANVSKFGRNASKSFVDLCVSFSRRVGRFDRFLPRAKTFHLRL